MTKVLYTEDKLDFLKEHYPHNTISELTALFNERFVEQKTVRAIKNILYTKVYRSEWRKVVYSSEMLSFLEEKSRIYTVPEITALFNQQFGEKKRVETIRIKLLREGFIKRTEKKNNMLRYTPEMLSFLEERYMDHFVSELTEMFNEYFGENQSRSAIVDVLHRKGWKKLAYTAEMLAFLEKGCRNHNETELTAIFNKRFEQNRTVSAIKLLLRRRGFIKPAEKAFRYTPAMLMFLKEQYKVHTASELTRLFNEHFDQNKTVNAISSVRHSRGFFLNKKERALREKNKGLKKMKPVGHERTNKDGRVKVKTADGVFRTKHIVLWEKHFDKVPEGMCLRFKDGDSTNITIDNLMVISRSVHTRLNHLGYKGQPGDLKPSILKIAELDQVIFEKERKRKKS